MKRALRILLALAIGCSLLLAPMAPSMAAIGVPASGGMDMSGMEMTSGGNSAPALMSADHGCCNEDQAPDPTKECQAAAGCFAKCYDFVGLTYSSPVVHVAAVRPVSLPDVSGPPSSAAIPPFRPPRT